MVIKCRKAYLLGILAPFFWEGGQDVVLWWRFFFTFFKEKPENISQVYD